MKTMESRTSKIFHLKALLFLLLSMPLSNGYTFEEDVYAINNLYVSLGSPSLPGWKANGGDPCVEAWQGVQCVGSNITSIILNGANLGGQLGDKLDNFTSITTIDLSNNNIGGSIPENLPHSMSKFFLSANAFAGSIPSSLSELTLLSDMSLNENHLTGDLPDAFESLNGLINLDLSSNNLTGPLPPSMANLSSLTTFHVQDNQLTGTLDVLQDLPLKNLNVENNQFSGPIPQKLLNIPIFLKDGNPFNTSIAPSPKSPPSLLPLTEAPPPGKTSTNSSGSSPSPSDTESITRKISGSRKKKISTLLIVGLVLVSVIAFIVLVLAILFCLSKYKDRRSSENEVYGRQEERAHTRHKEPRINQDVHSKPDDVAIEQEKVLAKESKSEGNLTKPTNPSERVPKDVAVKENEHEIQMDEEDERVIPHVLDQVTVNTGVFNDNVQWAPVIVPTNAGEKVKTIPKVVNQDIPVGSMEVNPPTSVTSYSVASLQQYTGDFKEENVILDGKVGKIYLAEDPQGNKLLAVLKLDTAIANIKVDPFLELVLSISELRHPKVTRLLGYCAEYEQRLLVYEYFSGRTLHDVLHGGDDDLKRKLSWNARVKVALEAAQALEYLHEKCQPPVLHKNFDPSSVLIDDMLHVCVSDCGLASLVSTHTAAQLSGRIRALFSYEAPEVSEGGAYTERSDVYSFGVVMLEILTGLLPYDSARPKGEQHLTRWVRSQMHDMNALSRMVDPTIQGTYPIKSLSRFADVISGCIQREPEFRPPMSQVVQDLSHILEESRGN